MNNIATLAENIGNDLALGLDKDLVIRYWEARQNANSNNANTPEKASRPRAVENDTSTTIARLRKASNSRILSAFAKAGKLYSYNSIAVCIYGEGEGAARGFTVKGWVQSTTNPLQKSIERMRAFLIGLEEGRFTDILQAPGGNRKG